MRDLVDEQLADLRRALADGWVCEKCDDPLCPPGTRRPWANGMREDDYEFVVEQFEGRRCVVLEFSAHDAPDVRYRHRFPPRTGDGPDYSDVHFMEYVETGKLVRSRARMGPEATVVVTDFSWGYPSSRMRLGAVLDLLCERRLSEAVSVLRRDGASEWDLALVSEIETAAGGDAAGLADEVQRLYTMALQRLEEVQEEDRAMEEVFRKTHLQAQ